MQNMSRIVDGALIALGLTYSLQNIQSILGIIILAIQIIWLLTKFITKVVSYIKEKRNIEELDTDLQDVVDKITDIKDNLPKEDNNDESKKS